MTAVSVRKGRVEREGAAFGKQQTVYRTIQITSTIHGKMERSQVELIAECLIRADGGRNPTSERWPKENRRRPTRLRARSLTAVPVLIIAGEEDRQFPVYICRKVAFSGSTFFVLPETAHLAARERPELVNTEIEKFLDQLPSLF